MGIDVVAEMSSLINTGRFKEAATLGYRYDGSEASDSAHYWFQYGLARTLSGVDGTGQYLTALYREDCTMQMRSDIYRDVALIAARMGNQGLAEMFLFGAHSAAADDNRTAAAYMVSARVAALDGRYFDALRLHEMAHELWQQAGDDADPQWVGNNLFYWLRMKALLELPRRIVYGQFVQSHDKRADRRRDAALFFWAGPVAAGASIGREVRANYALRLQTAIEDGLTKLDGAFEYSYN